MVEHLEVSKNEAFIFVEHIGANRSKVSRWDPNLLTNDKHVNDASLDMADKHKQENYVYTLQLTFNLRRLIQVGYEGAKSADSKQLEQSQKGDIQCQIFIQITVSLRGSIYYESQKERQR